MVNSGVKLARKSATTVGELVTGKGLNGLQHTWVAINLTVLAALALPIKKPLFFRAILLTVLAGDVLIFQSCFCEVNDLRDLERLRIQLQGQIKSLEETVAGMKTCMDSVQNQNAASQQMSQQLGTILEIMNKLVSGIDKMQKNDRLIARLKTSKEEYEKVKGDHNQESQKVRKAWCALAERVDELWKLHFEPEILIQQ